ncbi:hypothetical protein [Bacillus subtilis]
MDLTPEKSTRNLKDCSRAVSLETPIGEEDDSHLDFMKTKKQLHF